ncbi:MAG: guanylate kinase, partial [Dactylosporangium sp.]|nr:guanylate kinase [Dactylosporangium sp.]
GKTTIIREITRRIPEVRFIPSTTTRPPRPSERHGREYFFMTDDEFDEADRRGEFLEWQRIHGHRYGTSRRRFQEAIDSGTLAITSIDILGGLQVRKAFPHHSTAIFVRPSATAQLKQRLLERGDAEEDIETRMARVQREIDLANECDFLVLNDNGHLAEAVATVEKIIRRQGGRVLGRS